MTRFPNVSRETIETAVEDAAASFADTPIRDFIPLLVERTAIAKLASLIES